MRSTVFFFQAEDGIRDHWVTGVQTCALPISARRVRRAIRGADRRVGRDRRLPAGARAPVGDPHGKRTATDGVRAGAGAGRGDRDGGGRLDDRAGRRRRARHLRHGRGSPPHVFRRRRAEGERVLRRALRHRDGGRQGARRAPPRPVSFALDVSRSSDRSLSARRVLALLAACELCGLAPRFSASAVAPTLSRLWRLDTVGAAWLTISVQLGFVAGALVSALLTLSDRWSARRLVAGCAWLAGLATVGVAWAPGPVAGIALRML